MSKNIVGFKIADVMNIILTRTLEDEPQTQCAIICTMIMPHLLLARSRSENDASITKTLRETYRCALDKIVASNMISVHSGSAFIKVVLK